VEYFKYLGIIVTNIWVARWRMMQDVHVKLNPGLSLQKQISTGRRLYSQSNCTSVKEGIATVPYLERSFVWCRNWGTSGSRSEIPGEFWNVMLERDREDRLDWSCEKYIRITWIKGGEEYPTYSKTRKYTRKFKRENNTRKKM